MISARSFLKMTVMAIARIAAAIQEAPATRSPFISQTPSSEDALMDERPSMSSII
jgi:hypothetical protein